MAAMNFKALERFQYWQGQELRHDDFNAQLDAAEQLRWWHTHAVHRAFGVGFGLTVDPDFTVHCGIAYDCSGRELIVAEDRKDEKPDAGAGEQYLELSYAGLQWIPRDLAAVTSGVLLAHIDSGNSFDKSYQPVKARALSRPRLASGATPPGNTPWQKILGPNNAPVGLQVRIDTSSAGFTRTPLYVVSPVWQDKNTDFTPPYVTIADATQDGFTARLMLQGIAGEIIKLVDDVPTVSGDEWGRHQAGSLLATDVVARLAPRVGQAVRITSATNPLTVAEDRTKAALKEGGVAALVRLPASAPVQPSTSVITVDDGSPFSAGITVVLRHGGTTAGSAALIQNVLSGKRLLPKTEVSGLTANERLDVIGKGGTVFGVSADNLTVTFTGPTSFQDGSIVVRTSGSVEQEIPVAVDGPPVTEGKVIKLKSPILGLKKDDVLGLAADAAKVTAVTGAVTADHPDQFAKGDALQNAAGDAAIVTEAPLGSLLLLDRPLAIAAGGESVPIGNWGARSTITQTPADPHSVKVRNAGLFSNGDWVALRTGAGQGALALAKVKSAAASTVELETPLTGAAAGNVVALVRFGAQSKISVAAPLTVKDSSIFRKGDLVAVIGGDDITCAQITDIQDGGVLVLNNGAPTMAAGADLGVVFTETVAPVTAATTSSITVTTSLAMRAGWFAGNVLRWLDITDPVALSIYPDGTLPGDSVGLAALTTSQTTTRFATAAKITDFSILTIEATDEISRGVLNLLSTVRNLNKDLQAQLLLATQDFQPAKDYTIRPEEMLVAGGVPGSVADDFAVHAQKQQLSLCWLGCQIPAAPIPDCPGISGGQTCGRQ
jgi:hypothetical protein